MNTWRVKLLYDGQCPFCRREIHWLKRWDRMGYLALEDITDPVFDPGRYGLTHAEVTKELHGILPSGRIVRGVEAIRQAYRTIGLGWLVAPTAWPGLRLVANGLYGAFARFRLPLGNLLTLGRSCKSGSCPICESKR
jgi:predicted DCC family thiol-disulfide oxidoreductase YuxK